MNTIATPQRPKLRHRVAAMACVATLAVAGLTTTAEQASALTSSTMSCAHGIENVSFGLPYLSEGGSFRYWYRLDNGSWNTSTWYYSAGGSFWYWNNYRWVPMPLDISDSNHRVGDNRLVEGWEERVVSGRRSWISLGYCRTTSYANGGLTFTYGG